MTMLILYTGIAVFGLFCIIRPDYLLKRAGQKKKKEYEKKDERFIRIFGAVLVGLYILGFLI